MSGETDVFAFRVELKDGRVFHEAPGFTWDDVPTDSPVVALALVEVASGVAVFRLEDGQRYYFSNEAAALQGGEGIFCGKLCGMVTGEVAREIKLDLLDGARFFQRSVPAASLPFAEHAYRIGAS